MPLLSDHLPTARTSARRLAGLAALALLVVPLAACGADDDAAPGAAETTVAPGTSLPDPASLSGSSTSATDPTDAADPADPAASDAGETDPDEGTDEPADESADEPAEDAVDSSSPFVVAATAVGARSRDQVMQLHVMGVGTAGESGLPLDQLPALATNIRTELGRQVDDTTMLPPPAGSPAADLVAALESYRTLAGTLAAWDPDGAALGDGWFRRLATTDRAWTGALRELGRLSGRDLLADLAPFPTRG